MFKLVKKDKKIICKLNLDILLYETWIMINDIEIEYIDKCAKEFPLVWSAFVNS